MAQINLLSWREELRSEKKKEFLTQVVMVVLFAGICCFVWVQSVQSSIEYQNQRNQILQSEINLLAKQVAEIKDLKKRRQELISRMKVIQDLEGKRSIIVHYFDELARAVPDGVFLSSVERANNTFALTGISESNQRISTFMRQVDESSWFANPNLKSVIASPANGEQAGIFVMQFEAVLPAKVEEVK